MLSVIIKTFLVLVLFLFFVCAIVISVAVGVEFGMEAFFKKGKNDVGTLSDEERAGTCGSSETEGNDEE
ncbi:hypothetical protein SAMN04487977_101521 [Treponema bryantii]|uniref:Uncharacterized protein n=1 Tax=Treponema bryantii TaxID=163 RepID=A0A1H9AZ20_9SPIR|nr:hypothetical protein [Treponema bryantii]SEP81984.1 hypothetical protein SAMN04487977_101521 [Treponema bryantii]